MSVRKPLEKQSALIDALINKGAKVKEDFTPEEKKWTNINTRISIEMLDAVDVAVSNRVGITRTGWILEALHEKLKRENGINL